MANIGLTERLARGSARRPWIVLGAWVLLFVAGGILASGISDVLTADIKLTNNPESEQAETLIEEQLRGPETASETVIVASEQYSVEDPEFEEFVAGVLAGVRGLDGLVAGATSYYETDNPGLVSADGATTILPVSLAYEEGEATDEVAPLIHYVEEADEAEAFQVLTIGDASINHTASEISESDLQTGEAIGIPIALLILLLVFGAVLAAGIPLVIAIVSIVISVGITTIIGQAFELNLLVVNIITMIGLAVGIDYTLFIVHRYREELAKGLDKHAAIARAGATSSRAVLFSGGTVVIGLAGMFIVPSNIYRSLATGAIVVAVISVIASMTLLPAILSLLGDRINSLRLPFIGRRGDTEDDTGGFWGRSARAVMARPIISVVAVVVLLVAASIPFFTLKDGLPGVSTFPEDSQPYQAYEMLSTEFSAGLISPTDIAVEANDVNDPEVQGGVDALMASLEADPMFTQVTTETNDAGTLAVVSTLIAAEPFDDPAYEAMNRLRDDYVPAAFEGVDAEVFVGGQTATADDLFDTLDTYTPIVFAFVLGLSFILLLVVFRSIVVPVKALVMNLLSVGATYGIVVLVFQHGVGNEIFGFTQTDTIPAWLPLFLFAVIFGLSMDYHVFLLSRIRERFDETGNNRESVAFGVRNTAGIITGAAAIMVAVFAGFAMGQMVDLQTSGFGLALAVLLDATIIRIILVPASMALLGTANWYLPSWLEWLPDIRIEAPDRGHAAPPGAEGVPAGQ